MPNDNRIKPEQIDAIISKSEISVEDRFDCMTVVHCKTPFGFIITETSACIDPANYDRKIGYDICMERIKNKLWELEGYHKMRSDYDGD